MQDSNTHCLDRGGLRLVTGLQDPCRNPIVNLLNKPFKKVAAKSNYNVERNNSKKLPLSEKRAAKQTYRRLASPPHGVEAQPYVDTKSSYENDPYMKHVFTFARQEVSKYKLQECKIKREISILTRSHSIHAHQITSPRVKIRDKNKSAGNTTSATNASSTSAATTAQLTTASGSDSRQCCKNASSRHHQHCIKRTGGNSAPNTQSGDSGVGSAASRCNSSQAENSPTEGWGDKPGYNSLESSASSSSSSSCQSVQTKSSLTRSTASTRTIDSLDSDEPKDQAKSKKWSETSGHSSNSSSTNGMNTILNRLDWIRTLQSKKSASRSASINNEPVAPVPQIVRPWERFQSTSQVQVTRSHTVRTYNRLKSSSAPQTMPLLGKTHGATASHASGKTVKGGSSGTGGAATRSKSTRETGGAVERRASSKSVGAVKSGSFRSTYGTDSAPLVGTTRSGTHTGGAYLGTHSPFIRDPPQLLPLPPLSPSRKEYSFSLHIPLKDKRSNRSLEQVNKIDIKKATRSSASRLRRRVTFSGKSDPVFYC